MAPELVVTILEKDLVIYSYPLMISLALLACAVITVILHRINGISIQRGVLYIIVVLASALVFARLSHYLLNPEIYSQSNISPWVLKPGQFFMYGGYVGGLTLAALISPCLTGLNGLRALDLTAPGLASTAVFAKMGCFLHGCCFGPPAPPPLGLPVAEGSRAFLHSQQIWVAENSVSVYRPVDLTLLPVQMWESIVGLIGLAMALSMLRRSYPSGTVFFLYFGLFSLARCGLHFLRVDQPSATFQYYVPFLYLGCAGICAVGLVLVMWKFGNNKESSRDKPYVSI